MQSTELQSIGLPRLQSQSIGLPRLQSTERDAMCRPLVVVVDLYALLTMRVPLLEKIIRRSWHFFQLVRGRRVNKFNVVIRHLPLPTMWECDKKL